MEKLFTPEEVGEILGCSDATVRKAVKKGFLEGCPMNPWSAHKKRYRFKAEQILKYIKQNTVTVDQDKLRTLEAI